MQIDLYGLHFEASRVTAYLWTPWRAAALEHRLFNEIKQLPGVHLETTPEEIRIQLTDAKLWKEALTRMSRLLKGWQEEGTGTREQRVYRWLFEGDTDEHGYDHSNEVACLWLYLRVGLDRGDMPDGDEPTEWIDLHGFGLRCWPVGR